MKARQQQQRRRASWLSPAGFQRCYKTGWMLLPFHRRSSKNHSSTAHKRGSQERASYQSPVGRVWEGQLRNFAAYRNANSVVEFEVKSLKRRSGERFVSRGLSIVKVYRSSNEMESSYVVKVQNKGAIRRLTLARGEGAFEYEQLLRRIRGLFQLPASAQFGLTYVDRDGDVVTLAEDEDLKDALVLQALNPLRVTVENGNGESSPVLPNGVNSGEVTEQQTVQGETIPPTLSKSLPVEVVTDAKPVADSGKSAEVAEQSSKSGNSALPEENVSKIDVPSPASGTGVDAKEEVDPPEGTTENKRQEEAEGSKGNSGHPIHFGIQCDGCGTLPISGPRFVSRRRYNFDLCLKCYEASGAEENEYAKIDRLFNRIGYPAYIGSLCRQPDQRMCRKPDQRRNLTPDSAPKNTSTSASSADAGNKTAAEPSGPQSTLRVLHMGVQCDECGMVPLEGPRFKSSTRLNYDLCHSCFQRSGSNANEYSRIDQPLVRRGYPLPMGELVRESPHSRLIPLGGRWFWVLNRQGRVLAVQEAEAQEKTPAAADSDANVGGDAVKPPQAESAAESAPSAEAAAAEEVADATVSAAQQEGPTEEQAVDAKGESNVVQIPVINTNETQAPVDVQFVSTGNSTVNNLGETSRVGETVPAAGGEGDLSTQEGLLAKLAAMGFEDPRLNEELLEKNNFDLRKTLDDLCAAEEWDPILGELQEMGFYDANMNRRLMFKNKGSVKRVVKELVQMYKGENMA